MDDNADESPATRALHRHLTMIRGGDDDSRSEGFDPWACAEAMREVEARPGDPEAYARFRRELEMCEAADEGFTGPLIRRPVWQRGAARRCLALRSAIEAGDGAALMEAVAVCAAQFLVMPAWLAAEFSRRWHLAQHGEATTWDEVFGKPVAREGGKSANRRGVRSRAVIAPWAYELACAALEAAPSRPIDRELYAEVGRSMGRGSGARYGDGGHSQTANLIREYVTGSGGRVPPLEYVRAACAEGLSVGAALARWDEEHFEAMLKEAGFERGADGHLRPAPIPPGTENR